MPLPVAFHELVPAAAVKVQVKLVEAPAASVVAPPLKLAQDPPPVTLTPLSEVVPVLVSVTTTVTVDRHYLRAEVRDASGDMLALTNPVWID